MTLTSVPTPVTRQVDAVLREFLDEQRRPEYGTEWDAMLIPLRGFILAGGKRLRPMFRYLGWRGADAAQATDRPAIVAGAALELFHCFALIMRGYRAVGDPLGVAFQLRDDVLGVFGDPERTGKPAVDDLRQGKPTVLLALTLAMTAPAHASTVRSLAGDPYLDSAGADTVRDIMVDSGALAATERLIRCGRDRALRAVAALDVPGEVRAELTRLAGYVTERSE